MPRRFWTQTRVAELKRLWDAGATAAAIGKVLGGITRAAVLGKVFRLRLLAAGQKRSASTPQETPARRRANRPRSRRRAKRGARRCSI
jgi:GcrA cell cycle regulator